MERPGGAGGFRDGGVAGHSGSARRQPAPGAEQDTPWYVLPTIWLPPRRRPRSLSDQTPIPVGRADTVWYGWRTLLCDAGALGLWSVAVADSPPPP